MRDEEKALELKVGLFVFVGLLFIAVMVVKFGQVGQGFRKFYPLVVDFPNAGGIIKNSDVQMAGARIGYVAEKPQIATNAGSVTVPLKITEGIKIPRKTRFIVGSSGLLGDRFVEVVPDSDFDAKNFDPSDPKQTWNANDRIAGSRAGGLDELTKKGGEVMDKLNLEIEDLRAVTASIKTGLLSETNLKNLQDTFANLKTSSATFVDTSKNLSSVVQNAQGAVDSAKQTMDSANVAATNLNKVLDSARGLVRKAAEGDGLIPTLLNNRELADNLKSLVANMRQRGVLFYKDTKRPEAAAPSAARR